MSKYRNAGLAWGTNWTVDVSDCKTSREVMEKAGLDYYVDKCDLVAEMPFGIGRDNSIMSASGEFAHNGKIYRPCPNAYGTYRTDNNVPLGIVKQKYEVIQNVDAFNFFDDAIGDNGAVWDSAGSFGNGEKIVVTAKLPGFMNVGGGDPIDKYLVFASSHDGSCSINIMFTPVRVICTNVLNSAFDKADSYIRFRHTKNAKNKLELGGEILRIAAEYGNRAEEIYNAMAHIKMKDEQVMEYLAKLVLTDGEFEALRQFDPVNGIKKLFYKDYLTMERTEISTRKANQLAQIFDYYQDGIGQQTIIGTAWGAYNAVTGYYSNVVEREPTKRMEALVWGADNKKMNDALVEAFNYREAA